MAKYKKKKGVAPLMSRVMAEAGRIGGSRKTEKQLAAWRKNIAKAGGRPPKYTYDNKDKAIMGSRNPRECLVPDVVRTKAAYYKEHSFVAWIGRQRFNVRLVSVIDGVMYVKRIGGGYPLAKKKS